MDIASIYIHDGRLLRVIEDAEAATFTMEWELPASEWSDDLVPRLLVFKDVPNSRVCEGAIVGCPTLLDMRDADSFDVAEFLFELDDAV